MEVRKGYKQTDIGVIPEDWEVTTVGNEFSIQLGKMLDAEKNVGIPKPFLGNRSVQWGRIDISDLGLIKLTPSDLQRFRLREGDLLVCEGGEVGRAAIWNKPIEECYYQKALHRLRPKRGYNTVLMINILQHLASKGFLLNYVTQTSIAHLPKDKFETVPIILPTLVEQEAIAEALSDADALIEAVEQLLTKKRQVKQGAMSELLTGKRRLAEFSGKWELRSLVEYVKSEKFAIVDGPFGTQMKVDEYVSEGVPVIEMEHLEDRIISQRLERHITPEKFEQLKRSAVYSGDIVISKTGSLGHLGIIPDNFEKGIITSRLAKITLDNARANRSFIFQYLLKLRNDGYWERVSQGGTMQILGIGMLQNVPIPDISLAEQTAIAEILSDMDAEISALEEKLVKARQVKAGMMSELLTGKVRLV